MKITEKNMWQKMQKILKKIKSWFVEEPRPRRQSKPRKPTVPVLPKEREKRKGEPYSRDPLRRLWGGTFTPIGRYR